MSDQTPGWMLDVAEAINDFGGTALRHPTNEEIARIIQEHLPKPPIIVGFTVDDIIETARDVFGQTISTEASMEVLRDLESQMEPYIAAGNGWIEDRLAEDNDWKRLDEIDEIEVSVTPPVRESKSTPIDEPED